jgi:hypothetical protein
VPRARRLDLLLTLLLCGFAWQNFNSRYKLYMYKCVSLIWLFAQLFCLHAAFSSGFLSLSLSLAVFDMLLIRIVCKRFPNETRAESERASSTAAIAVAALIGKCLPLEEILLMARNSQQNTQQQSYRTPRASYNLFSFSLCCCFVFIESGKFPSIVSNFDITFALINPFLNHF